MRAGGGRGSGGSGRSCGGGGGRVEHRVGAGRVEVAVHKAQAVRACTSSPSRFRSSRGALE